MTTARRDHPGPDGGQPGPHLDDQQRRVLTALLAMQRASWEQGVAGHAFLDLGLTHLADVAAHDAVDRQTPDGRLAELDDDGLVNSASVGEVVRWAARRHDDAHLGAAFDRQVTWTATRAPRAADGTLFHLAGRHEVWVDTVYMVVPLLVLAGRVEDAQRQLDGHARRLLDPATGLYAHIWDEDTGRLARAAHWGTGNGWVAAGLARALHLLLDASADGGDAVEGVAVAPTATDHGGMVAHAADHVRSLVDACGVHRRADGLFHDVLDDPTTFTDANVGQMLAYATLTGVADGWLPAGYADVGRSLLATARGQIGPLGHVEGVCGSPRFDRQGRSAEAQAFFLLATAADQRLAALEVTGRAARAQR